MHESAEWRLMPELSRFIYRNIMQVGCDLYSEEDTWDEIRSLVAVFKPLVRLAPFFGFSRTRYQVVYLDVAPNSELGHKTSISSHRIVVGSSSVQAQRRRG